MTGIDERTGAGRFGTATPGARPSPPSLESILTGPEPSSRRRFTWRRLLALAGVLVLAAGGYLLGRFTAPPPPPRKTIQLVVTTAALPAGARLSTADLRVITVRPGAAVPPGALPPAAAAHLIGLVTRNAVPAGTFLQGSLVAPGGALPDPAHELVGLALKDGQLPAGGLSDGQQVLVVALPVSSQGTALSPVTLVSTTVWYLQGPDSSGSTLATIVVPAHLATRLAGYAARGEIALVATSGNAGALAPPASGSGPPAASRPHKARSRAKH